MKSFAWAIALGVAVAAPSPGIAACLDPPGDLNGSGDVTVADVVCAIHVSLWELSGAASSPPTCLAGAAGTADVNCTGSTDTADVLIAVRLALALPLGAGVDADDNACPDACQEPIADLAPPVITCPESGARMADDTPLLRGTGTAGAIVDVYEGASLVATGAGGAEWAVAVGAPQSEGTHTYTVVQRLPDGSAVSEPSAPVTYIVDTTPPPAVTGLVVVAGDAYNHLSWNPVSAPDLLGYEVWRKPEGAEDDAWARLTLSPVVESAFRDQAGDDMLDPALPPPNGETTYCYRVRAVDDALGEECPQ